MYKVWVLGSGESTWATNGLEFDTIDDARAYMFDLFNRWFGMKDGAILPTSAGTSGYLTSEVIADKAVGRL